VNAEKMVSVSGFSVQVSGLTPDTRHLKTDIDRHTRRNTRYA
jgi:hypothetical protein